MLYVQLLHRYNNTPKLPHIDHTDGARAVPAAPLRVHNIHKRLGPDGIASLIAKYEAGTTGKQLAQQYGISTSTVFNLIQEAGVLKRLKLTPEQVDSAIKLYESGLPVSLIARKIGGRPTAVLNALQRNGVRMRARGRRPRSDTAP